MSIYKGTQFIAGGGEVGDGTITIKQGGTTKGSFTTNQAGDTTINLDAGGAGGYHPDLLTFIWSDHQVNDIQWLRADTFSWQSGEVYSAAYEHLVDDITGKSLQSETIGSVTVQFYLADDGHKICPVTQESNVASIYSATGVAWYYILDTTNERFKLPRTKFGFTGLRDTVGKYVAAGLPNITGRLLNGVRDISSCSGALYSANNLASAGASDHSSHGGFGFDASRSSSIYGNSTTVQPNATQMYLYFYVGQYTQSAIEQTAGLNAELFNGKADISIVENKVTKGHEIIAFQQPTSGNSYTWYRKYSDGWVEQGGCITAPSDAAYVLTLPISMKDTKYTAMITRDAGSSEYGTGTINARWQTVYNKNTTNFTTWGIYGGRANFMWQVSGMVAI